MKNKSINMFIAAMVLLCLIAIMLIVFLHRAHENFDDAVTVKANGVTESVFKVRDLTLTPTDVKEYDVNLYCEATGDYKISLDYREIHDGGMKDYVRVQIIFGEEVIYDGWLSDIIDKDIIVDFVGELHETDPLTLTFRYEMPRNIGNEAQGTSADFDIVLTAKKY